MGKTSSQRPNIVWIGVDQMRYDTLGCNGNALCKTPNVDRIASQGICFDRAYCPTTLCTPARASMFTGQYAFHHGMLTNCEFYHTIAPELPDPGMLLHPRLARLGYGLGFAGKWHVGDQEVKRHFDLSVATDTGSRDYSAWCKENGLIDGFVFNDPERSKPFRYHEPPGMTQPQTAILDFPEEHEYNLWMLNNALELLERRTRGAQIPDRRRV